MQLTWLAFCLARASAGRSRAAKIAMIAITTSSSINVNANLLSERKWQRGIIHARLPLQQSANKGHKDVGGLGHSELPSCNDLFLQPTASRVRFYTWTVTRKKVAGME